MSRLHALREVLTERIDEVIEHLGISLTKIQNRYTGKCPVHEGNNYRGFSLYEETGIWQCFTKRCHEEFGKDIIGLIRGTLTQIHQKRPTNEDIENWTTKHLHINVNNLQLDPDISDKKAFSFQGEVKRKTGNISREQVRSRLIIPAEYYIARGHSPLVLNEFDVGLCNQANKEFSGRVVVPVYDENYKFLGASARTTLPSCSSCNLFHEEKECPPPHKKYQKWIHSKGFDTGSILYNFWKAKEYIEKTSQVILVEGPADIWKLWEAGYKNVLGMFTNCLSPKQILLLQELPLSTIIVCTDADEGGDVGFERIREKLGKLFNIIRADLPPSKDPADLTLEEIKDVLRSY